MRIVPLEPDTALGPGRARARARAPRPPERCRSPLNSGARSMRPAPRSGEPIAPKARSSKAGEGWPRWSWSGLAPTPCFRSQPRRVRGRRNRYRRSSECRSEPCRRSSPASPRVRRGTATSASRSRRRSPSSWRSGSYFGRDAREQLFAAPLDPGQIAEVEERLAAWGVPFVAAGEGVRVDPRRRNDLLLRLSLSGVPHAHLTTTSEALAKAGPLTPQSILDAQVLDGLAGDLALGLRGISGIDDARVILAPARRAVFADERSDEATGSVRLSLHPGVTLPRETVEGIRAFVAAGVPGLRAERITILDDRGAALGTTQGSSADNASELQTSLQSALDAAFGAGATIVRVHVTTDPSSGDVRDLRRASLGGGPIAAVSSEERYSADRKHYVKRQSNEDRGSEVHEERTQLPAGRTERISVAVMLDASRRLDAAKVRALAAATLGPRGRARR